MKNLFVKLLRLGKGRLSSKYRWRIQLAMGILILEMDLDALMVNRIDTWLARRASTDQKIRYHETKTIESIQSFPPGHPLRRELDKKALETVEGCKNRKKQGWEKLREACTGTGPHSGKRQIIATVTGISQEERSNGVNILEDREVAAELNKETLR